MERLLLSTCLFILIFVSTCNAQTTNVRCRQGDREALLDFKSGLNDPENVLSSWTGLDCCRWRGVGCENGTGGVAVIDLRNPYPLTNGFSTPDPRYGFWNLSGEIRPSLIRLKSLNYLDLSSNAFGGIQIPEFFGSLTNLQYLNLSNAGFSGVIPPGLGNLSNLQILDVSNQGFLGLIVDDFRWMTGLVSLRHLGMDRLDLSLVNSNWLETLNMLPDLTELHLSACGLSGSISNLNYINFTSLAVIDLSLNSFRSMFPDWLVNITSLVHLDLSNCMLRGRIPLGLGDLPNLRFLNLALNSNLSASSFSLFRRSWQSIEVLNLASNKLHSRLPRNIGNMSSLRIFDMSTNNIEGGIPSTIGSLCNLVRFDLSGNNMTGILPELLDGTENCGPDSILPSLVDLRLSNNRLSGRLPDWLGQLRSLEELSMAYNFFEGPLPDSLGSLRNLTDLSLEGNGLNGTLPKGIGQLPELVLLDVSSNSLTGVLSEVHFSKLSKLKILGLSSNSFILNVSSNWRPPFQVRNLNTGSCRLGPSFPGWLRSQNEIMFLDISNASISGFIPAWFWDLSFNLSLLNVSVNQLQGPLPSSFDVNPYADVDLSSNLFEGPVPLPSVPIELLDLSSNRFQGPIPENISALMPDLIFLSLADNQLTGQIPASIGNMSSIFVIDFSRNNLSGTIPLSIGECSFLRVLDLGGNNLSGEIPSTIGQLIHLQSLHLNDNSITGNLPSSLRNLSRLETLDLGNNKLEGTLPMWLGEGYTSLRILNLRSNAFTGEILFEFSNFTSLQVIDLGQNNLTGRIPTAWRGLRAMTQEQRRNEYLLLGRYRGVYYEESLVMNLKNQVQKFTKTLSLVTAIDISGNSLSGDFPVEITELTGLMIMNFSRNHITGHIPENISRISQLSSLDLSSNDLSGPVPASMASLNFLSYLNLSNNNLSGRIPLGGQMFSFGANAFEGNPGLCGAPLVAKCPGEAPDTGTGPGSGGNVDNERKDGFVDRWFYLSIGLGFAAGILVPYLVLMIRKPWSDKYFDFVDEFVNKLLSIGSRPKDLLK